MKDSASNLSLVAKRTLTTDGNNKIKVVEVQRYIVTIYVAAPGTPLVDKKLKPVGTSLPGHLYYSVFDFKPESKSLSFGFAPIISGQIIGVGAVHDDDEIHYVNPYYARTLEITKRQYDALREFGKDPVVFGFSLKYEHAKNNCVDFVWNALRHAGLKSTLSYAKMMDFVGLDHEGDLKPIDNVDAIKSIKAPFEKSNLNKEKNNPLPKNRNMLQKLLSENNDKNNQQRHV
ncbi:hypothetical protein [Iodobacter ciconiae]|uniref:Uncharacterized protein n=1 Tax=Iodobacter ciconiae TaxID=2496266 RepID=A0A3S8ZWZ1_9NEIS|nr:hypothetical protein [Iodobacter ciconiae]AZN37986.1 hypothetical protein EJO50_16840 [Iodobacter ciconiae]